MSTKRYLLAGSLALALGGGGSAAAAPIGAGGPPRASLSTFVCQTALSPLSRGIAVTAVMRPVASTNSMQVRFDLLRMGRHAGAFHALRTRRGNLGKWISPGIPTLGQLPSDVWKPTGQVANLPAPAYYRLKVSFRWLGSGGVRLAQAVRLTPACYQPELRPDLAVRSVGIARLPSNPADDAYDAVIANRGATAAGPFQVSLAEAQTVVDTITLPELAAHKTRRAHLVGPACTSGEVITVTADPTHQVDVWERTNSALSVVCP